MKRKPNIPNIEGVRETNRRQTLSFYQKILKKMMPADIDPRHAEAYFRLQYGTLSNCEFRASDRREIAETIRADRVAAEQLAQSEGL